MRSRAGAARARLRGLALARVVRRRSVSKRVSMFRATASQAVLLRLAQRVFIANQVLNFPLYYLPGLRSLMGGDGPNTKFPCSISWMTRTGLARMSTLILWNAGWFLMLKAFWITSDWRLFFMLQMYGTGFVTVVLTPMVGRDVAMGSADALHCYSAMVYVFDHFVANEFILGVPLLGAFGGGFAVTSMACGIFQFLRANDDAASRRLYSHCTFGVPTFEWFAYILEVGFMLTENLLFFVFLFGMASGITVERPQLTDAPLSLTSVDITVFLGIVATVVGGSLLHRDSQGQTSAKRSAPRPQRVRRAAKSPAKPRPEPQSRRTTRTR